MSNWRPEMSFPFPLQLVQHEWLAPGLFPLGSAFLLLHWSRGASLHKPQQKQTRFVEGPVSCPAVRIPQFRGLGADFQEIALCLLQLHSLKISRGCGSFILCTFCICRCEVAVAATTV